MEWFTFAETRVQYHESAGRSDGESCNQCACWWEASAETSEQMQRSVLLFKSVYPALEPSSYQPDHPAALFCRSDRLLYESLVTAILLCTVRYGPLWMTLRRGRGEDPGFKDKCLRKLRPISYLEHNTIYWV